MSAKSNEFFTSSDKTQKQIQASLERATFNTLLANRVPIAVADKLSRQVAENVNLLEIYKLVSLDIQDQRFPKQRVLDRTIVHMFEILYKVIYFHEEEQSEIKQQEFFTLVPRGECLDLFLQLVKEYCMGDEEIERYTYKIEPLIETYRTTEKIIWDDLYQSKEFKSYLSGLLNLILSHLRNDQKPIPALENKIPIHYQPYRINSFLNQICKLKQTGQLHLND
jgi:hypothetical protein